LIISNGAVLDFAPQALGEVTPNLASGYFYSQQGLELSGRFATYAKLYMAQPAVATVVDKVANSAARLSVQTWDITRPGGKVLDQDSPLARLMARPNSKMSPYNFWRWTFATLDIYGEAFWYKQRDSFGNVINLAPMHPSRVAVKRDHEGNLTYVFTLGVASAGLLRVAETEVVAFMRYNPQSLMRGMSRLEPLRMTLLSEDASRRATASWWSRGARPSVILKHPGNLSQGAQDRLKANFEARHAGADAMGGTAVLEEGMEAQVVQLSAEEMQYVESRKLNLQEVCMVYDVPPPVIHILDHATYSNITEQMRSMYRDTMAPRLEEIESVIDSQLRTEFYGSGERAVKFALDEVLRGDFETRASAAVSLVTNGVMQPAEARVLFDLPALGGSSEALYANGALVPLGTVSNGAVTPQETGAGVNTPNGTLEASEGILAEEAAEEQETPVKAITVRTIMGRLSRVKSNRKNMRVKLASDLETELAKFFDRQRESVKAALKTKSVFDPAQWDGDLGDMLKTFATATSEAVGNSVASELKGHYKPDNAEDYIDRNSKESAKNINKTTHEQIKKALANKLDDQSDDDAIDYVFDNEIKDRAREIAWTRVATFAGLAAIMAANMSGAKYKTWVVQSENPRASHAGMDGETVAINDTFSNGLMRPGDASTGNADEVAGCTCDMTFSS
jgi:HK97 family phage portal protein